MFPISEEASPPPRDFARRTPATARDFEQVFEALWNRANTIFGIVPSEGLGFAPWTEYGSLFRTAPTDVVDTGTAYQIKAEVPGIAKDLVDIRVNGNVVEISGQDNSEKKETAAGYLHRERRVTGFHRAFELPEPIVAERAKAQVVNGVLELEPPKQKPIPASAETKIKVEQTRSHQVLGRCPGTSPSLFCAHRSGEHVRPRGPAPRHTARVR
ncbi:MAG: Hsp20/alpha crystallin family protein [Thermoplasmata archaeon]